MSTTLLIGRCPAAVRRACSQSGEGATVTSVKTRAVKRGQSSGTSTVTEAWSATSPPPSAAASSAQGSAASGAAEIAWTSRATPQMPKQSTRFGVTSSSSTGSASGRTSASGVPGAGSSVEHEDAVGVFADFQLGDGEDHPFRGDPPQLRLAQLLAARHPRPGQGHGDGLAGGDVGGAADDRPLALAVTGVDRADPQPVGVGVRLGAQHPADDEALGRGRADGADPLDLGPGHHQPLGDLRHPEAGVAVLAQP